MKADERFGVVELRHRRIAAQQRFDLLGTPGSVLKFGELAVPSKREALLAVTFHPGLRQRSLCSSGNVSRERIQLFHP